MSPERDRFGIALDAFLWLSASASAALAITALAAVL